MLARHIRNQHYVRPYYARQHSHLGEAKEHFLSLPKHCRVKRIHNMSTNLDTHTDYFTDFFGLNKARSTNDRPDPTSLCLDATADDWLDSLRDHNELEEYTTSQIREQLDNSLYVGQRLSPTDLQGDLLESRLGTRVIWEKLNRYHVYEREAVLQEVCGTPGTTDGVISRARAGFEVLNTTKLMFIDVDYDPGSKLPRKEQLASIIEKARLWAEENDWGIRVYRTHSGARLMVVHSVAEEVGEAFDRVCSAVGADPIFQELCHIQGCYRARLTPKPERCGIVDPKFYFPFVNAREEEYFDGWLEAYSEDSRNFATCHLVATVGHGAIHPELQQLIAVHDAITKATTNLPLR